MCFPAILLVIVLLGGRTSNVSKRQKQPLHTDRNIKTNDIIQGNWEYLLNDLTETVTLGARTRWQTEKKRIEFLRSLQDSPKNFH